MLFFETGVIHPRVRKKFSHSLAAADDLIFINFTSMSDLAVYVHILHNVGPNDLHGAFMDGRPFRRTGFQIDTDKTSTNKLT